MGQRGEFAPTRLSQLQWTEKKDNYSYVEENTLHVYQGKSGKLKYSVTLEELNTALGLELKSFPGVDWKSDQDGIIQTRSGWYKFNVASKSGEMWIAKPDGGANFALHNNGALAYTRDNNVFVQVNGKELQVTDLEEGILAGQAIARYEFGIQKGLFWSKDGRKIGFYQKDERHVPEYPLVDYTTTPATSTPVRYPMAGSHSEHAFFGIFDVGAQELVYLDANNGVIDDSYYITNVAWTPDGNSLMAAIVNRDQNDMKLVRFNASNGSVEKVLFSESHAAYVEPENPAIFVPGKDGTFLWFSERDGFNNLYYYTAEGKLIANTESTFPITSFIGFTPKADAFYVTGAGPNPTERYTYRIEFGNMRLKMSSFVNGTNSSSLSPSGKYLINTNTSIEVPLEQSVLSASGKQIRSLHKSENPLEGRTIGNTELLVLKAKNGDSLMARMITPPDLDPSKKYPVLVYVYNGPHVQLVRNTWMASAPLWMHSLATDGYIVFTVDGRGSANRGRDFEQAIFRRLGTIEMQDQLVGVEYLKSLPYVDQERMAVHGWSFGGFMTTSLMLREPGTFKVGVAGGPVIDWSLYEVMYTERYMDRPEENPEGFEKANLTNYVSNLEGDLLMIHGTVDDVVVMQHNMRFLEKCVSEGVQVEFFAYPGHPHNVRGKDRVHLMTKVINYIKEKL